jgi:hypothetical protein
LEIDEEIKRVDMPHAETVVFQLDRHVQSILARSFAAEKSAFGGYIAKSDNSHVARQGRLLLPPLLRAFSKNFIQKTCSLLPPF